METNFWSGFSARRLSRRRALAATGGLGLGAAFLAACGGSSTNSSSNGAKNGDSGSSSLVIKPTDTTSQAKRGGVLKDYAQAEPRSLDPVNPLADYNRIAPFVYSTLLAAK